MPQPCGKCRFSALSGRNGRVPDFAGHPMASFRPETHKTLIALIQQQRKAKKLSLRKVVARLPEWMNFQFSTLGKIERGVRDVSYAELREIARVIDTTVAALDQRVDEIEAAKAKAARRKR
jgi:hypothetical protein